MRGTLNKAVIIGRLGKDAELKYTPAGIPISLFTLATNESYKDKEGKKVEHTDWHRIVAWRKLAEICGQYLKKGSLVCVEGQIKTRGYSDKAGVQRYVTEIVADTVQMLGARQHVSPAVVQEELAPVSSTETSADEPTKDDLPF